jgi:universal bacterial protein YeaZ
MIILGIDTTENTAAAALTDGETPIAARALTGTLTHSETMLPMILELFAQTGLSPADVELFACSAGPGSFTGVRIGVSLIKGLAFGRVGKDGAKIPCCGVSATQALAYNLRDIDGVIACPVMDARRNRFYNALFEIKNGNAVRLCSDRAIPADELRDELAKNYNGRTVLLCGGGAVLAESAFAGLDNVKLAPDELLYQSGVSAAVCAYRDYIGAREFVRDDLSLAPFYLRPPQADRKDF